MTLRFPSVFQRSAVRQFFEKLVEMRRVGKVQTVGNLSVGKLGMQEVGFGFGQYHRVDQFACRFFRLRFDGAVEVVCTDVQQVCIVRHLAERHKMSAYQLDKPSKERIAAGTRFFVGEVLLFVASVGV